MRTSISNLLQPHMFIWYAYACTYVCTHPYSHGHLHSCINIQTSPPPKATLLPPDRGSTSESIIKQTPTPNSGNIRMALPCLPIRSLGHMSSRDTLRDLLSGPPQIPSPFFWRRRLQGSTGLWQLSSFLKRRIHKKADKTTLMSELVVQNP